MSLLLSGGGPPISQPADPAVLSWEDTTVTGEARTDEYTLVLTVNRTGGTVGAVSALYTPVDGTAVNGVDFYASGEGSTIYFADGDVVEDTSDNIAIAARPDNPQQQFTFVLSNPTGCTIGGSATCTITLPSTE